VHPKGQNLVSEMCVLLGCAAFAREIANNFMHRSSLLLLAMLAGACTGTEGDILRTPPGVRPPDDAATARPRPTPLSSWQIQLSGALDTTPEVQVFTSDLETPSSVIEQLHSAGRVVIC
jgi:hypothetical protein